MATKAGLIPLQNVKKINKYTSPEGDLTFVVIFLTSNVWKINVLETSKISDELVTLISETASVHLLEQDCIVGDSLICTTAIKSTNRWVEAARPIDSTFYKVLDLITYDFIETSNSGDSPDNGIIYTTGSAESHEYIEKIRGKDSNTIKESKKYVLILPLSTGKVSDTYLYEIKDLINIIDISKISAKESPTTQVPSPDYPGYDETYFSFQNTIVSEDIIETIMSILLEENKLEIVNTDSHIQPFQSIVNPLYNGSILQAGDMYIGTLIDAVVPIPITDYSTATDICVPYATTDYTTSYLGNPIVIGTIFYNTSQSIANPLVIAVAILVTNNSIGAFSFKDDTIYIMFNVIRDNYLKDSIVRNS